MMSMIKSLITLTLVVKDSQLGVRRAREGQTTFTMTFSLFVALKTLTLLVYFHVGPKDFGEKVEYCMMCEIGPCIMSKLESQSSLSIVTIV